MFRKYADIQAIYADIWIKNADIRHKNADIHSALLNKAGSFSQKAAGTIF